MGLSGKAFIAGVILTGTAAVVCSLLHPLWPLPAHFVTYLLLVLLASGIKVRLLQAEGTVSVSFVLVMLAIVQLSPAEVMVVGCLSVLAQCLYRVHRRFRPGQIAFNVANIANATALAAAGYGWLLAHRLPLAPALALASCAYFLCTTLPPATVMAITQKRSPLPLWFRSFRWYFPYYLCGAAVAAVIHLIGLSYGWGASLLAFPVAWAIYTSYRLYLDRLKEQKRHMEQMTALHLRTIEALALAIEAKDRNTHNHLCRVRVYALALGQEMGLSADDLEALRAAAVLHDIGKLAVPEYIINKPGKLTPEEFEQMKIHPVVGAELLQRVNFPYPVVPIVRSHHEHWDGRGYPDGLAGEQIPVGARILTAVDCLDALASDRPYRRALTLEQTMERLRELAGIQFDPRVIEILGRRCVELEALAREEAARWVPLRTNIRVARGEEPAAGFEQSTPRLRSPGYARQEPMPSPDAGAQLPHPEAATGNGPLQMEDALRALLAGLRQMLSFDCLAVHVVRSGSLVPVFAAGAGASLFSTLPTPLEEGLCGWVAQNGLPIVNGNPTVEPGYLGEHGAEAKLQSALALPLRDAQQNLLGVLALHAEQRDGYTQDDLSLALEMSGLAAMAIEQALHAAPHAGTTDCLTGALLAPALNTQLEAELTRCRSGQGPLAVMVCDVHRFQRLNATYGHVEGNRLLRQLAQALRQEIRATDTMARLGPDRFVLLLPGLTAETAPDRMAALEAAACQVSSSMFGGVLVEVSFGVAFAPQDGVTTSSLLLAAQDAMYRARREGRHACYGQTRLAPVPVAG